MSLSQALTLGVTVGYLGIAVAHVISGRYGFGLTFAGYAIANLGIIAAERS